MAHRGGPLGSERGGYGTRGGLCTLVGAWAAFLAIYLGRLSQDQIFFVCCFSVKTCGNFVEVLQTCEVGGKTKLGDEGVGGFVSQDY